MDISEELLKKTLQWIALTTFLLSTQSPAADMSWSGRYRYEAFTLRNETLKAGEITKNYMLNHLILYPKIIAADGFNIYGRFDIMNSARTANLNSQAGQFVGNGPNSSPTTGAPAAGSTGTNNSNALSQNQASDTILINELYMMWTNEFGYLIVGRAPINFGLGMRYNSGKGEFDHWLNNEDLVGYKIVMGNMFLMPMFGKVNTGALNQEDDINDYMVHFQYENSSNVTLAAFYNSRVSTHYTGSNDAPTSLGGPTGVIDSFEGKQLNIFVNKKADDLGFGLEAGFQSGTTGVQGPPGATGPNVAINGFGLASETKWTPPNSRTSLGLKLGFATGDDPNTTDQYEGYLFNRNYNVAMLLFNHVMGRFDIFRTAIGGKGTDGTNEIDTETLSNVLYAAPELSYKFSQTMTGVSTLTWATLNQNTLVGSGSISRDVGIEWDLSLGYRPHEKFTWLINAGMLFPGQAFEGGNSHYSRDFAYGLETKAAVTF